MCKIKNLTSNANTLTYLLHSATKRDSTQTSLWVNTHRCKNVKQASTVTLTEQSGKQMVEIYAKNKTTTESEDAVLVAWRSQTPTADMEFLVFRTMFTPNGTLTAHKASITLLLYQ